MSTLSITSMQFLNPIRYRVSRGTTSGNQFISTRIFAAPLLQSALAQVVFIVEPQFFQAGARDVRQLQLGLFRSTARLASFGYILCAATRSLDHLIVGTIAPVNVPFAEAHRHIEAELSYLKALELSITAMCWNQTLGMLRCFWRRLFHCVRILVSGGRTEPSANITTHIYIVIKFVSM